MIKNPKQTVFSLLTFILDIFWIVSSFLLAFWLRFYSGLLPVFKGIPPLLPYLKLLPLVVFIYAVVYLSLGVYSSKRLLSYSSEAGSLLKSLFLAFLLLMSFSFLYRGFSFSRLVFILFNFLLLLFTLLNHRFMRGFRERMLKRGIGIKKLLLVGEKDKAKEVERIIQKYPLLGYQIAGMVSLKERNKLKELIQQRKVEKLVLVSPPRSEETLQELIRECSEFNIDFTLIPGIYSLLSSRLRVEVLDGIPMISLKETPLQGVNLWVKRMEDIVLSSLFLLVTLPIFPVIALLIKLTSPGPVFYRQERVGLDGKPFLMLKFRTMRVDAEKETGPVWAKPDDPRRTRVGKWLRKLSLDELPQLINVLKGEMSLVGPRPERPVFVEKFRQFIPEYMSRHRIKAGITGWAQVNGLRGNTPLEERIKYDLYYLENWSLWFDLRIIFLTLFTFHREAY